MKLLRFGNPGNERPGIHINDKSYDLTSFGEDFGEEFFDSNGIQRLSQWLAKNQGGLKEIPAASRIAAPFKRPSKIICIGLNYSDHASESKMELPKEPIIFFKSTTALVGPNDPLVIPKNSIKTDWEVELAVVIGKKSSYINESDAIMHIVGFCLHNDYSEREFQLERSGQWVKGKSCDTFAPMGPWVVTPDEIPDLNNLNLWLTLNGKTMQQGNTSNLIFKPSFLVSYVSQFMTLLPGDIISTGTPAGVGLGMTPPHYIKPNDVIQLGIDHLGSQTQNAFQYS